MRIFNEDPLIPEDGFEGKFWKSDFNLTLHIQDEIKPINPNGNIFLTNIHRVYEKKKTVTDHSKSPINGNFVPSDPKAEIFADKEKILEIVNGKKGYQILDVRSDDERNGINLRGGDRGGYIPTSVHKEWVNFNTSGDVPILKSSG